MERQIIDPRDLNPISSNNNPTQSGPNDITWAELTARSNNNRLTVTNKENAKNRNQGQPGKSTKMNNPLPANGLNTSHQLVQNQSRFRSHTNDTYRSDTQELYMTGDSRCCSFTMSTLKISILSLQVQRSI